MDPQCVSIPVSDNYRFYNTILGWFKPSAPKKYATDC